MATFGFIGTGNMGGALARAARKRLSGGEILLANRSAAKAGGPGPGAGLPGCGQCGGGRWGRLHLPGREALYGGRADGEDRPRAGGAEGPVRAGVHGGGPSPSPTCGSGAAGLAPDPHHAQYPSAIGEGVIFYTCDGVTAEEEAAFLENMAGAGRLMPLDDHLMDAGSAVAGCGPAFVDLFIEAMADGGVACGLTRPMAMECAAQTLIGAARLMLETGRHPGALKDAVCSPAAPPSRASGRWRSAGSAAR